MEQNETDRQKRADAKRPYVRKRFALMRCVYCGREFCKLPRKIERLKRES